MISGPLYGRRYDNHTQGDAALIDNQQFLLDTCFFYPSIDTMTNDCLAHAVNFALRYPIFTNREQLVRLMQKRMHYSKERAKYAKAKSGVSLKAFTDFFLFGNEVYSLIPLNEPYTLDSPKSTLGNLREAIAQHLGYGAD
jgi:hypothetical protein